MLYADDAGIVSRSRDSSLAKMMAGIVAVCASFGLWQFRETETMFLKMNGIDRVALFSSRQPARCTKKTPQYVYRGATVVYAKDGGPYFRYQSARAIGQPTR